MRKNYFSFFLNVLFFHLCPVELLDSVGVGGMYEYDSHSIGQFEMYS